MGTGTSIKLSVALSALAHAVALGALVLGGFTLGGHAGEDVFFVELKEARLVSPGREGKAAPAAGEATVSKKAPRPKPEIKKKEPAAVAPPPEPVAPEAEKVAIEEKVAPVSPGEVIERAPENFATDAGGDAASEEEGVSSSGASSASPEVLSEGADSRVSFPGAGFGETALSSGPGSSRAEALASIRRAIEEELTYPPLARRRRLEGTVLAGFAIDEGGAPRDIEIVRSSGFSVLDDEVLKIIRRAAPFPYIPERVEVPVSFRLVGPR